MREFRKQVIRETVQALERGWYQSVSGRRVQLDLAAMEAHARRGRLIHQGHEVARPTREGVVEVLEGDCLSHALALQAEGFRPVCLNMASHRRPGGGYLEGAGAQEENLFRRTAYHAFIGEGAPWRPTEIRYPLPEFAGVYSPDVAVLRGPESERYPFLDEPQTMSFVAVAAYLSPPLIGQRLTPQIAAKTLRKLRLIFEIALGQGHDALVLSALGCGAFRNPPSHLAELFSQALDQGWARSFRRVRFAILDDHNAVRAGSSEGNLRPFQRVLGRS